MVLFVYSWYKLSSISNVLVEPCYQQLGILSLSTEGLSSVHSHVFRPIFPELENSHRSALDNELVLLLMYSRRKLLERFRSLALDLSDHNWLSTVYFLDNVMNHNASGIVQKFTLMIIIISPFDGIDAIILGVILVSRYKLENHVAHHPR